MFPLHQQLEIHLDSSDRLVDPDRWRWTSPKIKHRDNGTLNISFSLLVLSMTSLSLPHPSDNSFIEKQCFNERTNEGTRSRTMISLSFRVVMSSRILRFTVFRRRVRACIDPHSLSIVNQSVWWGNQRFFRRFLVHKTKQHWFERWKRIEDDGRWTKDERWDPKSTWNPNHTLDRSSEKRTSFQSLAEGRMKKKMKRDLLRWVGVPKESFHLGRRFLSINRIESKGEGRRNFCHSLVIPFVQLVTRDLDCRPTRRWRRSDGLICGEMKDVNEWDVQIKGRVHLIIWIQRSVAHRTKFSSREHASVHRSFVIESRRRDLLRTGRSRIEDINVVCRRETTCCSIAFDGSLWRSETRNDSLPGENRDRLGEFFGNVSDLHRGVTSIDAQREWDGT